ncbi:hypothetical protein [Roseomonas genomospecies 6]|uniref:hypothetical protein n=1 Tax=Roseomonas genomospecies 6 TaxID=214106 RepID=UPI0011F1EB61|nr:hypothetical protein [Roseomonas genomospecies 6]
MLADIARAVGDDATFKFAWEFGDSRLHIPEVRTLQSRPDHRLVQVLGWDVAVQIANALGGSDYSIPTGRHAINFHRARTFRAHGWSYRDIARVVRMREDTVKNHCADVELSPDGPHPVTERCLSCGTMHTYEPPPAGERA